MLFELTAEQADMFAACTKAGSSDSARPILTGLQVEWEVEQQPWKEASDDGPEIAPTTLLKLTLAATDSYMLATRTFELTEGYALEDDDDPKKGGSYLVEGKALVTAIASARKATARTVPDEMRNIVFAFDNDGLQVTDRQATVSQTVRYIEGTYPNWRQLIPEPGADADLGNTAAFNPAYVKKLFDSIAPKATAVNGTNIPVRMEVHGALKPAIFVHSKQDTNSEWRGLLMPVRV